MTGTLVEFPSVAVLRAVQELEQPSAQEAEELAASILVEAVRHRRAVPPWTRRLLLSTLFRHAATPFGVRLAEALAVSDPDLDTLVLGDKLLSNPCTRCAGLRLLATIG